MSRSQPAKESLANDCDLADLSAVLPTQSGRKGPTALVEQLLQSIMVGSQPHYRMSEHLLPNTSLASTRNSAAAPTVAGPSVQMVLLRGSGALGRTCSG